MKGLKPCCPLIGAVSLLAALSVFGHYFPSLVAQGFILPAGQLAAWILGVTPTVWEDASLSFQAQGLWVQVTSSCSGYSFFSILCAWLVYRLWSARPLLWLLLLPICWLFAVCVNALRVAASVHTCKLGQVFLSDSYQNIIHQATGMLVFLTFLIALAVLLQLLQRYVAIASLTK
jgi:exosortase/archaeosortase family protein